jgi:adenylate kinase family enzyme
LICVVGPPGAGKTTLTNKLIEYCGGSKFRLREAVRERQFDDSAARADPLGWVSDDAVDRILTAEARNGLFATGPHPVLLDNFPGSVHQLRLLHARAEPLEARIGVIELDAPDPVLVARVRDRRVCRRCGPDLHTPAAITADTEPRCRGCGGPVSRRDSDDVRLHTIRVARYRASMVALAATAGELRIVYRRLAASESFAQVAVAATRVFQELTVEEATVLPM